MAFFDPPTHLDRKYNIIIAILCYKEVMYQYTQNVYRSISIIKDMIGAKLLPMTVSAYPVDCVYVCHLLKTQHCCLCSSGRYTPPPAAHPSPPTHHPPHPLAYPLIHTTCDNTMAVKNVAQNQTVFASLQE